MHTVSALHPDKKKLQEEKKKTKKQEDGLLGTPSHKMEATSHFKAFLPAQPTWT